jgi:hypothetical protein
MQNVQIQSVDEYVIRWMSNVNRWKKQFEMCHLSILSVLYKTYFPRKPGMRQMHKWRRWQNSKKEKKNIIILLTFNLLCIPSWSLDCGRKIVKLQPNPTLTLLKCHDHWEYFIFVEKRCWLRVVDCSYIFTCIPLHFYSLLFLYKYFLTLFGYFLRSSIHSSIHFIPTLYLYLYAKQRSQTKPAELTNL